MEDLTMLVCPDCHGYELNIGYGEEDELWLVCHQCNSQFAIVPSLGGSAIQSMLDGGQKS